jgi:hypothetical protein
MWYDLDRVTRWSLSLIMVWGGGGAECAEVPQLKKSPPPQQQLGPP